MKEEFTIAENLPRQRLDVFLREKLPALSRGTIQRLLAEGAIRVDGNIVKPTHHPRAGEIVVIEQSSPKPVEAKAEDIPLDIIYEDNDMIVINKPAGLVVHPAAGNHEHTLVNALLHHCRGQLSGIGGEARPGIVHRLDKGTSGCIVAAKNDAAHVFLSAQFSGRSAKKIYQAIVCGQMTPMRGEINAALARDPVHRKRMAVTTEKKGRASRTSFQVLKRWAEASLVELEIHTGRTHQIRAHLKHIGFPVAGDDVYGARATARLENNTGYHAPRPLLHACRLKLTVPSSRQQKEFHADFPEDMRTALAFFNR